MDFDVTLIPYKGNDSWVEKTIVGAKYDRLIGVLESFNRIKKAHNAEMPVLRANYTVMSENAGEIEEFAAGRYSSS